MEAIVYEVVVYNNILDKVHNFGRKVKRLIIPEMDNLSLTLDENQVYVSCDCKVYEQDKIIKTIEVSEDLIRQACLLQEMKDSLLKFLKDAFESDQRP